MVLVAKARVGSNPTYHPNILKEIPVYEPGEVTVGNHLCVELYGIVECKDIFNFIGEVPKLVKGEHC